MALPLKNYMLVRFLYIYAHLIKRWYLCIEKYFCYIRYCTFSLWL